MGYEPLSSDGSVLPMGDWKPTGTKRGLANEWKHQDRRQTPRCNGGLAARGALLEPVGSLWIWENPAHG